MLCILIGSRTTSAPRLFTLAKSSSVNRVNEIPWALYVSNHVEKFTPFEKGAERRAACGCSVSWGTVAGEFAGDPLAVLQATYNKAVPAINNNEFFIVSP
jgi:hypothetical protein